MKNQIGLFGIENVVSKSVGEAKITYRRTGIPFGKVRSSRDTYDFLLRVWNRDEIQYRESFCVLCLSRCNQIIAYHFISHGGTSGVVVDPKMVFQTALLTNASALIVAHNHPSGQLTPSSQDLRMTDRIKKTGELMEMPLLDHVIVTEEGHYSFADEGHI